MSEAEAARRVLKLLDLTDLSDSCSDQAVSDLCEKAKTPLGPVAAVCVWPQLVSVARDRLQGSPVRVATVINFPKGGEDVERVVEDAEEALGDGADEIDCVMPHAAVLRGEPRIARDMIAAVRDLVDNGRTLKIILETGALGDDTAIEAAGRLAIEAGADFLKTSTGRAPVSATPQAVEVLLRVIAETRPPVGLKVSGGIRTLADAMTYLDLVDARMGEGWVTASAFRIGASSLYDALIATIGEPGSR
jgi:deoxyribose-phosphate aldolase